ncbi:hypothetical protein M2169_005843 [Streptomyces sp. MJP52]|nr:hypothetical protein [Streptomyces sp. MJP52]
MQGFRVCGEGCGDRPHTVRPTRGRDRVLDTEKYNVNIVA